MKFLHLGDEFLRLDLITHIKEGSKEETLYGRSVRKSTDHRYGWLEVHFVSGEAIKIEGEAANVLRQFLSDDAKMIEPAASPPTPPQPVPARRLIPHETRSAEPVMARHDLGARRAEEHRPTHRNAFHIGETR